MGWRRISTVLGALACLAATGARADLSYTPEEADGIRVIIVAGKFDFDDNLSHFVEAVRAHDPVAVTFNSPGGNVSKAMELGRAIRGHRLNTIQVRGGECASACALAFMGGVIRLADPGAIGVHKASFSGDAVLSADDAVSAIQQLTAEVMSYMAEMGVDPSLLQLSLKYDSDDMRYLSKSEMQQYRVTSGPNTEFVSRGSPELPTVIEPLPRGQPNPHPPAPRVESLLSIPEARSGRVRHPKGIAPLKAQPDNKAATIDNIRNGMSLEILGSRDRWFQVRLGGLTGYMHHAWVYVNQFQSGPFNQRHVQIKSFDNLADAESFVRAAPVPLAAWLASNGWFAITLPQTFDQDVALGVIKELKSKGYIPEDSIMTYGNTYVRQVCCN